MKKYLKNFRHCKLEPKNPLLLTKTFLQWKYLTVIFNMKIIIDSMVFI